jgi:hypothetical protein
MRSVNIIKVVHADKVGFDLYPITYPTTISVNAAIAGDAPFVMVKGYGDYRPFTIPVTGDVTIMNGDGVVLTQESYERLTLKTRVLEATDQVCKEIKDAMGLDEREVTWGELHDALKRVPQEYPSSIQGANPQQFTNASGSGVHLETTRYSGDGGKYKFVMGPAFDKMDELIKRGHADHFATMFAWAADSQPNGYWYLWLNTVERDDCYVAGILTSANIPFIIVTKTGCVAVDSLGASEKETLGLHYVPDKGWGIEDLAHRQVFSVKLTDGHVWGIDMVPEK